MYHVVRFLEILTPSSLRGQSWSFGQPLSRKHIVYPGTRPLQKILISRFHDFFENIFFKNGDLDTLPLVVNHGHFLNPLADHVVYE